MSISLKKINYHIQIFLFTIKFIIIWYPAYLWYKYNTFYNFYDMSLSENLRAILHKKGVSINALEKTAGVKPGSVQNILYGRSKNPGIETLMAIAHALNISLDELRGEPSPYPQSDVVWDRNLYAKVIEAVCTVMNDECISSNKRDFLECVDKIYAYSKESLKDQTDHTFARWLLTEKFKKYSKTN